MEYSMADLVWNCVQNYINVEMFGGDDIDGQFWFGVRLRPYGKRHPKDVMALGAGETPEDALYAAIQKAARRDWESLNFSVRPWHAPVVGESGWTPITPLPPGPATMPAGGRKQG